MKKLLLIKLLISLILIGSNSFAATSTCKELYKESKWKMPVNASDTAPIMLLSALPGGIVGLTLVGEIEGATGSMFLAGLGVGAAVGPIIILSGIVVGGGTIIIHNSKPAKMIKLIDQAEFYDRVGGVPGKQLTKLFHKISDNNDLTLKDLAKLIVEGNKDLSLCTNDLVSFRRLAKWLNNGEVELVNND